MDIGSAFQNKIERRLSEWSQAAASDFKALEHEMAARGLGRSGAHFQRKASLISAKANAAVNWCFSELRCLPGDKSIWREIMLPFIDTHVNGYVDRLVHTSRLDALTTISPAVEAEVDKLLERCRERVRGEFDDMGAGLWSPSLWDGNSDKTPALSPSTTINNEFNGAFHGVLQQAGSGALQQVNITTDARALEAALNALVAAIEGVAVSAQQRTDLMTEIDTMRPQLRKDAPNWTIIQAAAQGLAAISCGVAGNLLTPQVQAVLQAAGLS